MGVGSSPIGSMASPVEGKLLFLQGEGNLEFGPPQPLFLPSTMVDKQKVTTMTEEQFSTTLTTKGTGYTYPLLARIAVTTTEEMMQIAPIAPYFVYDGFDNDLDAACVLERILLVNPADTNGIKHLKNFLMA